MKHLQYNVVTHKNEGVFVYLLLFTVFFFLLEISFFVQCNRAYLGDFTEVADKLAVPFTILPGIIFFIGAQLLVHLAFCGAVWFLTTYVANLFTLYNRLPLGISIWTIGIITILLANQYFFPNSKFSELTAVMLPNRLLVKWSLLLLSSCCLLLFICAVTALGKQLIQNRQASTLLAIFLLPALIGVGFSYSRDRHAVFHDGATLAHPNIILVGVDSLRPDFLGYFGHPIPTPFFDSFLTSATVFKQAVTPLARTFPSWSSILSGLYPRELGIRTNLAKQQGINLANTLPAILQNKGYHTLYATDETRFSNIDTNFGFDRIVSPPIGLNDFLLGTFNDFPLSNLLINTKLGEWLFPYSYANRPAALTYHPASFLKLLGRALPKQRTKPLLLAVHFCLPHFPYLLADVPANDFNLRQRYEATISRVDQQVGDFFAMLKQYRLLDHAVVVLLSDHGEALELPGDRITDKALFTPGRESAKSSVPMFYPPSLDNEEINQSAGHGTDVLGLSQYHTLLAFKLYGVNKQQAGMILGAVSLLDIKPTILQFTHMPQLGSSGESLVALIQGGVKTARQPKHLFLETDFTPTAIRTLYPETRRVMLEGIQLFQVDPVTTRLTTRESMEKMIIASKQYADLYGEWMLALYPQDQHVRMPILVHLPSGKWTNDLHSNFALHSPAAAMLKALKMFYGNEVTSG